MTVKHGTRVWQGPVHSDRRTALQNETGGREKHEEIIGKETPEQRGLQRAKRFLGHMLVQKWAEAGVIVLIYTIRHPIRWVRNSSLTVVTSSYITAKPVDSVLRHEDTQIAMLCRRRVRERRGGSRSRGIWSASRSHLTGHLSRVYSIEWFCIQMI